MNIIKKALHSLNFFGYRRWQNVFEKIDNICLVGMNMGRGGDLSSSGELAVLEYIKEKNSSPLVVFDVGANIGDYSSSVEEFFQNKASVYAFEPSKHAFQELSKKFEKSLNVKIYNFGLSSTEETTELFSDTDGSGLGSVYKRRLDHFNSKMEGKEEIVLHTLDNFCKDNTISNIDFLKLDVEGHELKVLEGARSMLRNRSIKYIQFEFGGCNIDSRTFFQDFWYLLKDDFVLYRIVKDGIYPIHDYKESYERFVNTNFFAERK